MTTCASQERRERRPQRTTEQLPRTSRTRSHTYLAPASDSAGATYLWTTSPMVTGALRGELEIEPSMTVCEKALHVTGFGAAAVGTDPHPYRVAGHYDVCIAIGILVSRCKYRYWAASPDVAADSYRVRQFGPRNLWAEVEAAYRLWVASSEPGAHRWNFVVTQRGQRISLARDKVRT